MSARPVADRHVHTEWSWDARHGNMRETCARAMEMGLPAIALTEHADFTPWAHARTPDLPPGVRVPENPGHTGDLDIAGYWSAIDACREAFPQLHIESGVEIGEAHLFPDRTATVLGHRAPDRVLGSVHCVGIDGVLVDMSTPRLLADGTATALMRRYLQVTLDLVQSDAPFSILTHIDYPKRYWPHDTVEFDEHDFEEEYRAILEALAQSGRILEINSSRALAAPRGPCPGPVVLRWWHEAGGEAITFGSDAHRPEQLAAGLSDAADLAEAAGFRPGRDPLDLWGRGVSVAV
jgi:histidinol-phosphatase (PHP family)